LSYTEVVSTWAGVVNKAGNAQGTCRILFTDIKMSETKS
jgi:hypothetical protein